MADIIPPKGAKPGRPGPPAPGVPLEPITKTSNPYDDANESDATNPSGRDDSDPRDATPQEGFARPGAINDPKSPKIPGGRITRPGS